MAGKISETSLKVVDTLVELGYIMSMIVKSLKDNNAVLTGTAGYSVSGYQGNRWGAFVDGELVATYYTNGRIGRWVVLPTETFAHPEDGAFPGRVWNRAVADLYISHVGRRARAYIRRFLELVFEEKVDVREAVTQVRKEFWG